MKEIKGAFFDLCLWYLEETVHGFYRVGEMLHWWGSEVKERNEWKKG